MKAGRGGLLIFGAGGHGRVVASTARAAGWKPISFVDPSWPGVGKAGDWLIENDGINFSVIGTRSVIVAIGDNERRLVLADKLVAAGSNVATIVHPTAWVCPSVAIGVGTFIGAQAAVNNGASIGRSCIVNTAAVVEHDCTLADGVHVSPGAILAGGVEVGRCGWIGAGSSVRPLVRIGERAVIGIGAAVVSDVPAGVVYCGVPARALGEERGKDK